MRPAQRVNFAVGLLLLAGCSSDPPKHEPPCEEKFDLSSDPTNGGYCGHTCGYGQSCVDGACTCLPPNTAMCSHCTDLSSDPFNCGACAAVCQSPTSTCEQGKCVCKGVVCGVVCVDPASPQAKCKCGGTASPCEDRPLGECKSTTGCAPAKKCVGGAFSCAVFDHACTACNGQTGCDCEAGTGLCKGSTTCEAQSWILCKPSAGCSEVDVCAGTPPACETLALDVCEKVPGCLRVVPSQ